jgi:hypothetical protein
MTHPIFKLNILSSMNIVITEQIAKINIPDGIPQNNVMTDN